ncbi:amidase [Aestuariivirga litoralis]|uniref:amidase n=1 Tax=Aestuariivirga litoralis TaxID=2650924 RepID=UPI0018C5D437|nr:amidase family protein [Aestuariivirga litoralis]MBG1233291.1 amidase [Aestuariivirga litoralis]
MHDLIRASARDVVGLLKSGKISPLEVLTVVQARVAAANPATNALATLCFDRAEKNARELMKCPAADRGLLGGLPLPIKDLTDVAGVRSTQGSRIFANRIAETSDILVEHLEAAGGVVFAMSNTPEFGAGGHTFNDVFPVTRNPWNTSLSAAGSSGGAAAALASGMAWLAHGSDMGGSLRSPASFCGVVGLRPSPGRVAASVFSKIDGTLGVEGPMARNVADLALLLDAMSGTEAGDPLSMFREAESFQSATAAPRKPRRVAVSRNLGITPVDPEVEKIVMAAAAKLAGEGVIVEEAHPDLSDAMHCFQTLRALGFATGMRGLLRDHRDLLKPEVIWNIEKGLALSGDEIAIAEGERGALFRRMHEFLGTYDLLLCPATIVPPFPVEERYVTSCAGVEFETYVDWLLIAGVATLCACPALSLPCGFTAAGLPVGLQVIVPNRQEAKLLGMAAWIEQALGLGALTPIEPRAPRA